MAMGTIYGARFMCVYLVSSFCIKNTEHFITRKWWWSVRWWDEDVSLIHLFSCEHLWRLLFIRRYTNGQLIDWLIDWLTGVEWFGSWSLGDCRPRCMYRIARATSRTSRNATTSHHRHRSTRCRHPAGRSRDLITCLTCLPVPTKYTAYRPLHQPFAIIGILAFNVVWLRMCGILVIASKWYFSLSQQAKQY